VGLEHGVVMMLTARTFPRCLPSGVGKDRGNGHEESAGVDSAADDPGAGNGLPHGMGHRMLTIGEVAEWFRVPVTTVRGWVDRRRIPFRKVGELLRFPEGELEAWSRPAPKPTPRPDTVAEGNGRPPLEQPQPGRRYRSVKLGVSYDS
jgi:excisionase family DNA binding protein